METPIAMPTHKGFGLKILDGVVRRQLDGNISMRWGSPGLRAEIDLPIEGRFDNVADRHEGHRDSVATGTM